MVYMHLAEGFEEIEAITAVDLLRRAEVPVKLVSVTGSLQVNGAHGISVCADILFEEADYSVCDMMVLPGGMPGTVNLAAHSGLCDMLRQFAESGKRIAAICAAPMVLGGLGLLADRKATIYPGMEAQLLGAEALDEAVVKDGNLLTSQGPGTAMRFALALIAELCGEDKSREIREELIIK